VERVDLEAREQVNFMFELLETDERAAHVVHNAAQFESWPIFNARRLKCCLFSSLTQAAYAVREPGCFYTQAQCSELEAYAAKRGVTIIPEIDMPGHSQVFTRSMGFDMQTEEGRKALRVILKEVGRTFPRAPYIHIGGAKMLVHKYVEIDAVVSLLIIVAVLAVSIGASLLIPQKENGSAERQ